MLFIIVKSKPKVGIQFLMNLPYLAEVQGDISELPYQYLVSHLDILRYSQKLQ